MLAEELLKLVDRKRLQKAGFRAGHIHCEPQNVAGGGAVDGIFSM